MVYFVFFSGKQCVGFGSLTERITNQMNFFSRVQIYMKDAECAESNEKSNFRFLFSQGHFCIQNMVNFQ